jgi:hypothetical protein
MKSPGETLFQILCVALTALLLALSLYHGARRAELNDAAARDKAACQELRRENRQLLVSCACAESLKEIEDCALELGMQPVCADQIVSVKTPVG